jgi:hypothetical protein
MPLPGENAMNKLSKEKRDQLILVMLLTVGVLAGLWFGLITAQKRSLVTLDVSKSAAEKRLQQVKFAIESAEIIESRLQEATNLLAQTEATMASGDLYSWAINTIRKFKLPYKVEIPQFSQIDGPRDVTLLPNFPYKQASMTISGTAPFHDFGRFLADFENQFPYIRVLNVSLEPMPIIGAADREKLTFKMEIAALVKPSTP